MGNTGHAKFKMGKIRRQKKRDEYKKQQKEWFSMKEKTDTYN